jgi:hypothetical protein
VNCLLQSLAELVENDGRQIVAQGSKLFRHVYNSSDNDKEYVFHVRS